jgi:glycosyltransferase involved in cell wall biosynthesis
VLAGSEKSGKKPSLKEEDWEGIPIYRYRRGAGYKNPVFPFDPDLPSFLQTVIEEFKPDVAHVHHHWNLSDDLVRRLAVKGIPVVCTLHDFFTTCALFFRLPNLAKPCDLLQSNDSCGPCLESKLGLPRDAMGPLSQQRAHEFAEELAAASAIIVPSNAHKDALSLHVKEITRVVPLGIPYRKPEQHEKPQEKSSLCVLHFGHLSELKGTNILLRAIKLLQTEGRDVHLILAGSELGTTLDLTHVEVIPKYDWDSLVALAARSDVAVFPSLARETYGLVVDEALALGLPVVVSDRGALSERIGDRGVVVRAFDVGHLASTLRNFLKDSGSLARLRGASAKRVFNDDEHAQKTLEVYSEVLKQPAPIVVDLDRSQRARIALLRDLLAQLLGLTDHGGELG